MYQSETAPWLWFRAWATDGSAKIDLVYNTSGISIKVARDNLADSAALTLSAASGPTDWAAGKFHQVVGNLYKVGIATASISSYTGKIAICGSYTGGTIEGIIDHVSAYNPAYEPLRPTTVGRTIDVDAAGAVALDPATQTQVTNIENASGYLLAVLAGACADPQTASETYAITVFGSTFTVDMAGQTSAGVRTAPTLTKS